MEISNAIRNAIFILVILFLFIGFVLIFTVTNAMNTQVRLAVNNTGIVINETQMPWTSNAKYVELKQFLITNVVFLVYFLVLLMIYSSFVNPSDVQGYIVYAVGILVMTAIVSQLASIIWNQFATYTDILDFSDFTGDDLWFINNLAYIIILNLLAGLLSFVFVKRGQTT